MALYVLLSFDDEGKAKEYVKQVIESEGLYTLDDNYKTEAVVGEYVSTKVEGVFKKPTKFCDETDGHRAQIKKHMGWVRGRRYGWNVCSVCGKPNKGYAGIRAWISALGVNLLPRTRYMPHAMPMNWDQSPAMWRDLIDIMGGEIPHPEWSFHFPHIENPIPEPKDE